jgi:hypothetical protein
MTATGSVAHLHGLTPEEALLGQVHCSCGRAVERAVDAAGGPATYQCVSFQEQANATVSQTALERGKVDAERLEEIWQLEEDADPPRERELLAEEEAVMADFDRTLPPSADSPPIDVTEEPGERGRKG